jgi:hypothetical protein
MFFAKLLMGIRQSSRGAFVESAEKLQHRKLFIFMDLWRMPRLNSLLVQVRDEVGVAGSTWVEQWRSGKPDFHAFGRTTRSANELVEGHAVFA